ncbi:uncharacterized protein LOC122266716 [Penaeus japonicus]|uniref:uncharacterized protein LOC122266716 n=1 Tax=Penaeus japonicus TaxID=27405 RepID=UPI001C70B144|nr:uncharacterized protein LOC122266716 [Penaeus japonicus]
MADTCLPPASLSGIQAEDPHCEHGGLAVLVRLVAFGGVAGGRDARGTVALLRRSRHPERNSARNQSRGEDVRVLLGGTGTHRRPPPLPGGVERQRRTSGLSRSLETPLFTRPRHSRSSLVPRVGTFGPDSRGEYSCVLPFRGREVASSTVHLQTKTTRSARSRNKRSLARTVPMISSPYLYQTMF